MPLDPVAIFFPRDYADRVFFTREFADEAESFVGIFNVGKGTSSGCLENGLSVLQFQKRIASDEGLDQGVVFFDCRVCGGAE